MLAEYYAMPILAVKNYIALLSTFSNIKRLNKWLYLSYLYHFHKTEVNTIF